jgi:hypothetical protein
MVLRSNILTSGECTKSTPHVSMLLCNTITEHDAQLRCCYLKSCQFQMTVSLLLLLLLMMQD